MSIQSRLAKLEERQGIGGPEVVMQCWRQDQEAPGVYVSTAGERRTEEELAQMEAPPGVRLILVMENIVDARTQTDKQLANAIRPGARAVDFTDDDLRAIAEGDA